MPPSKPKPPKLIDDPKKQKKFEKEEKEFRKKFKVLGSECWKTSDCINKPRNHSVVWYMAHIVQLPCNTSDQFHSANQPYSVSGLMFLHFLSRNFSSYLQLLKFLFPFRAYTINSHFLTSIFSYLLKLYLQRSYKAYREKTCSLTGISPLSVVWYCVWFWPAAGWHLIQDVLHLEPWVSYDRLQAPLDTE